MVRAAAEGRRAVSQKGEYGEKKRGMFRRQDDGVALQRSGEPRDSLVCDGSGVPSKCGGIVNKRPSCSSSHRRGRCYLVREGQRAVTLVHAVVKLARVDRAIRKLELFGGMRW